MVNKLMVQTFMYLQVFWMWILNSIYHSILLFWMPMFALQHGK